jgi:hypothetical protein
MTGRSCHANSQPHQNLLLPATQQRFAHVQPDAFIYPQHLFHLQNLNYTTHATNYYYFHPDLHQPPSPIPSHAAAGTTLVVPTTALPSNTPRDLLTFHHSIPLAHRSLCWQRGRIPRYLTFASRSIAQQKALCFPLPGPAIPPARSISSTHSLPKRHVQPGTRRAASTPTSSAHRFRRNRASKTLILPTASEHRLPRAPPTRQPPTTLTRTRLPRSRTFRALPAAATSGP